MFHIRSLKQMLSGILAVISKSERDMKNTVTIKFRGRTTLELYHSEDEYDIVDFYPGETQEVELVPRSDSKFVTIHFDDGSMAMNVPVKLFFVISEDQ